MAFSRAEAYAPATVANLGVGFDILGMALEGMGDRATVTFKDRPGIVFTEITGDGGMLPRDPETNVASVSARAFLDHMGEKRGLEIALNKGLPLSSGLGSSAASAVVAVIALNKLYGEPYSREELLPFCLEGEALVSGYHADNVAPCLLGGITLVAGIAVDAIRPLPAPKDLHIALVTPEVAVPTAEARALMPTHVTLKTLIYQTGRVAQLIDALHRGDLGALGAAVDVDKVAEPARAHLIPFLNEAREAAEDAGGLGVFIGGAGPTLCAICDERAIADRVSHAMRDVFCTLNLNCQAVATRVDCRGSLVLHAE